MLTELIANGETHKVYTILNLLHGMLKNYEGKELRALLSIDMQVLLHKSTGVVIEPPMAKQTPATKVVKKKQESDSDSSESEGGLLDDILGGGGDSEESEEEQVKIEEPL